MMMIDLMMVMMEDDDDIDDQGKNCYYFNDDDADDINYHHHISSSSYQWMADIIGSNMTTQPIISCNVTSCRQQVKYNFVRAYYWNTADEVHYYHSYRKEAAEK
jgi:hypothetical protein